MSKLKINYMLNLSYELFLLVVPLFVTPYVSRILTENGLGQYGFSYSIAYYFILLGAFGFNIYGQREIAMFKEDRFKQSKAFWEMFILRFVIVVFSITLYSALILFNVFENKYKVLMIILLFSVFSSAMDISFLFKGNEDFAKIVSSNIIIRIITIVLIFVLIKKESDLWIYCLLQSTNLIGGYAIMWLFLRKYISFVPLNQMDIRKHFIPALKLFLPTIATSVYTMLDKTLLGVLVKGEYESIVDGEVVLKSISDAEVGMYEQSEKLVKMLMTAVTALGVVMIPKNTYAVEHENYDELQKNVTNAARFTFLLGFPMAFGFAALAKNFCPWYFGMGFDKCPYLIMLFCPLIIIIGLSNLFGVQFLVPLHKDNYFMISIIVGAIVNVGLDFVLIPIYKSYGAAVATLIAELSVTMCMIFFSRRRIAVFGVLKTSVKYFLFSIIMFGVVYFVSSFLQSSIINTILLVVIGVVVYMLLLIGSRDKFIFSIIKKKKEGNNENR